MESAEHFTDFLSAAFGGACAGIGGEVGGEAGEEVGLGGSDFAVGIGKKEGVDAIDLAEESEGGLHGGDIGDGKVVIGSDEVGGRFEEKADLEIGLVSARNGAKRVADFEVEAIGERAGDGDGVGFGNESGGIGRSEQGVLEAVGDEFCVGEWIDADEMDKLARVGGKGSNEGEGGGEFADSGILAEDGNEFFGETKALAFDGEVGSAGDEVERGAKGAESGFVDGLDGDNGGNADGEGGEVEK